MVALMEPLQLSTFAHPRRLGRVRTNLSGSVGDLHIHAVHIQEDMPYSRMAETLRLTGYDPLDHLCFY